MVNLKQLSNRQTKILLKTVDLFMLNVKKMIYNQNNKW